MCGNSKLSTRRQNENTLVVKKITGVDKRKKNLINVSKFQIVHSQSERKHTGCQENYSHFPEL